MSYLFYIFNLPSNQINYIFNSILGDKTIKKCQIYIYINLKMSIVRTAKKGGNRQTTVQQPRRQYIDRQIFTLQYLNHTMNYILSDNKSLNHYLEVDQSALEKMIKKDSKTLGLHFVQRIKFMKQQCNEDCFMKDLQQYGDFINYELPKSYQRDLLFIENEFNQEIQTTLATKRLKKFYPALPTRMTSTQIQTYSRKMKQDILALLINNIQMVPEVPDSHLQRNYLYRQMFAITSAHREEPIDNERNSQRYHDEARYRSASETGIANKMRSGQLYKRQQNQKKGSYKKKIVKVSKRLDSNGNEPEEYFPKVPKKSNKNEDNPLIIDRPILQNPYLQQPKKDSLISQTTPQIAKMQQQNEHQSKYLINHCQSSAYKNQFLNEDVQSVSSKVIKENELKTTKERQLKNQINHEIIQQKQQLNEIKKQTNELRVQDASAISNSQQKVKRKYNKTHKEENQGKEAAKVNKVTKKERVQKQKGSQMIKRQKKEKKIQDEDTKKIKIKKTEQTKLTVANANEGQKLSITMKSEIAFVSIAIQTTNEQNNLIVQKKQPIQSPQMMQQDCGKAQQKANITDILKSSQSYQSGGRQKRQDAVQVAMDDEIQHSQPQIQNPLIEQQHQPPIIQQIELQNNKKDELDISQFLN